MKAMELIVNIFKEIIGNEMHEDALLSIIYILYNYQIYFNSTAQQEVNLDVEYPLELTFRASARLAGHLDSGKAETEDTYIFWMAKYQNEFANPHDLPEKYLVVAEKLLNALKSHRYIGDLIKDS